MDENRQKKTGLFENNPPPSPHGGEGNLGIPGPQLCPTNLISYGRATPTPKKPKPTGGGLCVMYIYYFFDPFNTNSA